MKDWDEAKICGLLKQRFKSPEYAFFRQVADSTGFDQTRWADAIAVSLWPSRGLEIIGIEVKVNRSDWIKELRNPSKAESIAKYCHRWYIAAPKGVITELGELPSAWGLIRVNPTQTRIVREAQKREPQPLEMPFLAALLRRAYEKIPKLEIESLVEQRTEEKMEEFKRDYTVERYKNNFENLANEVEKFEKKSGLKISYYYGNDIGKLVELCQEMERVKKNAQWQIKTLRRQADDLEKDLKEVDSK